MFWHYLLLSQHTISSSLYFLGFGFPQNSSGLVPRENGSAEGVTPIVAIFFSENSSFIYLEVFTGWRVEHRTSLSTHEVISSL